MSETMSGTAPISVASTTWTANKFLTPLLSLFFPPTWRVRAVCVCVCWGMVAVSRVEGLPGSVLSAPGHHQGEVRQGVSPSSIGQEADLKTSDAG